MYSKRLKLMQSMLPSVMLKYNTSSYGHIGYVILFGIIISREVHICYIYVCFADDDIYCIRDIVYTFKISIHRMAIHNN